MGVSAGINAGIRAITTTAPGCSRSGCLPPENVIGYIPGALRRTSPMLLQIDKKLIEPDITVLEFTGKISLGRESQRIETMVNELLAQKVSKLIFDLSKVDYIDSAGLGIMTY